LSFQPVSDVVDSVSETLSTASQLAVASLIPEKTESRIEVHNDEYGAVSAANSYNLDPVSIEIEGPEEEDSRRNEVRLPSSYW
jgi:hypothetical protein